MKDNFKPLIRFNSYSDDWFKCKISDFGKVTTGTTPSTSDANNYGEDYFFISPADIDNKRYIVDTNTKLSKKGFDLCREIKPYSVLFVSVGSTIGKVAINKKIATSNQQINSIEVSNNHNCNFIYSLLENKSKEIQSFASTQAVPIINKSTFENLEIFVPQKDEEQKIGEYLLKLDEVIELHETKYNKLVKIKETLLDKMFPQGNSNIPQLRFKGFSKEWNYNQLSEIGRTFTGLSGKTKADFGHGSAHYVTYMNVFANPIADLKKVEPIEIDSKQNQLQKGDVLFTTSSETPEEVGMTSIWTGKESNCYLNSFCFGYRPNIIIDNYYLGYYLRNKNFRDKIVLLAQGISRFNISKNKVIENTIHIPENEEQKKIGEWFKELDKVIQFQKLEIDKLVKIKETLLDKMFV